jgi:hypothetical protein
MYEIGITTMKLHSDKKIDENNKLLSETCYKTFNERMFLLPSYCLTSMCN